MLRCPKCNRTYQDDMQKFCTHDGGRLAPDLDKPKSFDPNATVTGTAGSFDVPPEPDSGVPTLYDLGATIAAPPSGPVAPPSSPPTSGFRSSDTAPTAFPDTSRMGQQQPEAPAAPSAMSPPPIPAGSSFAQTAMPVVSAQLPPQGVMPGSQSAPLPTAPKKSRLSAAMITFGALLLVLLVGGGVAGYFLFIREKGPRRGREVSVEPNLKGGENMGTTTPSPPAEPKTRPGSAPPNSLKFENSSSSLDGKLAEHYVDFYFYFPQLWQKNPNAGVRGAANFVEVERKLPPDYTQENVTVSWYESKGTVESDLAGKLPSEIKARNAKLASRYPEYQKVSEGKTTVNGIEGYEFRFKAVSRGTDKGDIFIWGRVVYLPPGDLASTKGVTLYMFTTSLAPELKSVDDVGVKGELPIILNSFTLGKS